VACGADAVGIPVVDWEEFVVAGWQRSGQPCGRSVAGSAGSRPASRDVIWICGSGEICLVARVARSRRSSKNIVDMAFDAVDGRMCAGQREWRVVMVERRPGPGSGGVAGVAGCGEARRCVGRIGGPVPICRVAAVASSWQSCVVVVDVAQGAVECRMRSGQREGGVVVIEGRGSPVCR